MGVAARKAKLKMKFGQNETKLLEDVCFKEGGTSGQQGIIPMSTNFCRYAVFT